MGKNAREKAERRDARKKDKQERMAKIAATILSPAVILETRRGVLEAGAKVESCILSTRVFVDMALRLGFRCTPVVVEAMVMNPAASEIAREVEALDMEPTSQEFMEKCAEEGGHFVILGAHDPVVDGPLREGFWVGHLVAIMEDHRGSLHLVDVSLDQAARPKKKMLIRPAAFPVPDEFLEGSVTVRYVQKTKDGECFIDYRARPYETGYEDSPDWARRFAPVVTTTPDDGLSLSIQELDPEEDQ